MQKPLGLGPVTFSQPKVVCKDVRGKNREEETVPVLVK